MQESVMCSHIINLILVLFNLSRFINPTVLKLRIEFDKDLRIIARGLENLTVF